MNCEKKLNSISQFELKINFFSVTDTTHTHIKSVFNVNVCFDFEPSSVFTVKETCFPKIYLPVTQET